MDFFVVPNEMCFQFKCIRTMFAMEGSILGVNDNMPFVQAPADERFLAHLAFVQFLLIRRIVFGGRVLLQCDQCVIFQAAMIAYECLLGLDMQLLVAFQIRPGIET